MMTYLLQYWRWSKYSIIFSKSKGLQNAHYFISKSTAELYFFEVEDDVGNHEDPFIEAARKLKDTLELDKEDTMKFLHSCLKLGLINSNNWYFLLGIDSVSRGMEDYRHNSVMFSTVTLFDEDALRRNTTYLPYIEEYESRIEENKINLLSTFVFIHDALASVRNLVNGIQNRKTPQGITGPLRFDSGGARSDANFRVIEMGIDGKQINQRLLKVVTIEERPYVSKKVLTNGKIVFEGFCVDLLNKLSEDLNFDYQISIVADGKYGDRINGTKEWDGMIGEVLKGEFDAAVAPITVTANRLEVVDFTDPFLQLGISMLMRIPEDSKSSFSILSFFWPLSSSVWIYWVISTIITVFVAVIVSIISPKECSKTFDIPNSIWYLVCILLRAGSGYNCHSAASRLVSTFWWTFSLILIAQYTANFAAVLTVDRKSLPFNSFEELSNQTEYDFGTIQGGSTMQFFMYSRLDPFRKIWLRMKNSTRSVFVKSNHEGVQKVLKGKYVYLMESTSLEYELTQHCNLTKVGNVVLGSNGYSIALPKGSKWRDRISRQILDYNEKGIMMIMKKKWWKKTPQIEECEEKAVEVKKSLGMDKVSGIFAFLAFGLFAALIVATAEKAFLAKRKVN
ncbi:hypothetical protein FO519_006988 [Halicephalobus sp. NKZ332]|nr:hypothetical protein FO519_006988 [Halicephalobus sp. NKZ332]